jgi:hypothetical protein
MDPALPGESHVSRESRFSRESHFSKGHERIPLNMVWGSRSGSDQNVIRRAFAVMVDTKRLPVFLFSGVDVYHDFQNDAFCDLYNLLKVRKIGKREVVLCQPLPQTL